MLRLMRLEWKKNKLGKYCINSLICTFCITLVVLFMALSSKNMNEPMFTDYSSFVSFSGMITRITFIVFASVLLAAVIIDEYKNNTISILFSYPISRKKVMASKLIIVMLFCTIGIIFTTLFIEFFLLFFNPFMRLFPINITLGDILKGIFYLITSAIMCSGISLISLAFGMKKKSTPATITSSVVIAILINSTISNDTSVLTLNDVLIIPLFLGAMGWLIGYFSYYKIDFKDIG